MTCRSPRSTALRALCIAGLLAVGPAHALYKVVGPDGKVTYTDRPPPQAQGRVVPVGKAGAEAAPEAALPFALRELNARFPVVLYATAECAPCDRGRELLRQRGIPYRERLATSEADRAAWLRMVGSPEAPALTVGAQSLHGFSPASWNETLDVAGYPKESRLPPNYQPPAPAPLVEARPAEPASPPVPLPPEAPFTPASGIRF
jgi:glutaredoxin